MAADDQTDPTGPAAVRSVHRPTPTFKPRRRRLSPNRRADLGRWLTSWGLEAAGPVVDWAQVFGPVAGVALDVGFGHGETLLDLARRRPELGVVGIEVHTAGVTTVLEAVERDGLTNVRVVHGDALGFLDRVPTATLARVQIYFPDPWPKVRQRHRRLVDTDVVAALADRLCPGGELRLATDVEDYAEQMRAVCDAEPTLAGGVVGDPDDRPRTRFEVRGDAEGRTATDLRYVRRAT